MAKRNESIHERAERFVAEAQQKYTDALAEARQAAETTATTAWQGIYQQQRDFHRNAVSEQTKVIIAEAGDIAAFGASETHEKAIRDAVKAITEERIRFEAWRNRAVFPISMRVNRCEEIIAKLKHDANEAERNESLISHGLARAVGEIVDGWPKAEWDDEAGIVTVTDGRAQANATAV